jgi:competence protein ComEA
MHAWCRRTVIVTALTLIPWAALAADKPAGKPPRTTSVSTTVGADAKVNINTADARELATLEGVAAKVAQRIVTYRDINGPFRRAEDLRKVEGVSKGVVERNRDRIVVR